MTNTFKLLAPWYIDRRLGSLRVKSVQVQTVHNWNTYFKYKYLSGIGFKLNQIPRHSCGTESSAIEQLERAQRLLNFTDATGCKPINSRTRPKTHRGITLLEYPDHLTYWQGPAGEPLILVEPYTCLEDLKKEILERGLTALVLEPPGIYGGGSGQTTSVLLTTPDNKAVLEKISKIDWSKPLGIIGDINWYEALCLGKGRQS
jgi:hypothetical protein